MTCAAPEPPPVRSDQRHTFDVFVRTIGICPALTRVSVEHRGWEALSDEQLAEDCALPGGYANGSYARGWAQILARFAAAAGATGNRQHSPGATCCPGAMSKVAT